MYEDIKNFWSPKTEQSARHMILPPVCDWTELTDSVLPSILTKTIKEEVNTNIVVEIGCGIGRLMRPLSTMFSEVVGIDISQEMIEYSKDYLSDIPNTRTILTDGISFNLNDDYCDFIYSVICFQHIPYREMIQRYLRESFRILKPNGIIRVQTHLGIPLGKYGLNMWEGHFYQSKEIFGAEFSSVGFTILELDEVGPYIWITAKKL